MIETCPAADVLRACSAFAWAVELEPWRGSRGGSAAADLVPAAPVDPEGGPRPGTVAPSLGPHLETALEVFCTAQIGIWIVPRGLSSDQGCSRECRLAALNFES